MLRPSGGNHGGNTLVRCGKDGGGDSCDDGRVWQKRGHMCYWIDNERALVHCWRVMKVITEKESLVSIRNMDKLLL